MAAEVLDHTANLGTFMSNVKRHLRPDGILVVAMHNPQAFEFFLEQLLFKGSLRIYQHTHWQNETTIKNLLDRYGLKLNYREFYHYGAFSRLGKVYDILTLPIPSMFSRCVMYVAGHKE
jgi:2-polyprenyl-3-methyl-5-hydroxy-6-metoxy-1,4-benzoquinol methylase